MLPHAGRLLASALLLAVVSVTAASVRAQEGAGTAPAPEEGDDQHPPQPQPDRKPPIKPVPTVEIVRANLEPAYLAYAHGFSGLDPLVFESNVVAHFFVNRPSWPFAIVLTPKVVLRMFREDSTPVKTPSYMPRITAYFWFDKELKDQPGFYGSVMLSHHSNGQSGSFYAPDGKNNHEDGDFSTNYLEFSAYATGIFSGKWFGWSAMSFEWHPGFNMSSELRGRYGLYRLHLATTVLANLPLKGQLNVRVSAILDGFQKVGKSGFARALERFPFSLRYTLKVPGIDLGLYASYYVGHDYYNIYFDRLVHMFQIGIAGGVTPSVIEAEP